MKFIENGAADYKKIIVIAFVAALFIPMVVNGGIFGQVGFGMGEGQAKFYLNGVRYDGVDYLTDSSFTSGLGGDSIAWGDDKITVDVDGPIDAPVKTPIWDSGLGVVLAQWTSYELSEISGLKPDVGFEIVGTPALVDISGNPIDSGYTRLDVNAAGDDMYSYHYLVDLKMDVFADTMSVEETIAMGMASSIGWERTYRLRYDGTERIVGGLAEIGVINDIYALLSIDIPVADGWDFGWQINVDDIPNAEFTWSDGNEAFTEYNYQTKIESYAEGDPSYMNYDDVFHFNFNENIQRSHSGESEVHPVLSGNEVVGAIGLTQAVVPGVYSGRWTGSLLTGNLLFTPSWYKMTPTDITYTLLLKLTATDVTDGGGGNTTTTTTTTGNGDDPFDPWKGFSWEDLSEMDLQTQVMIGGGVFIFVVVALVALRSKRGGYY